MYDWKMAILDPLITTHRTKVIYFFGFERFQENHGLNVTKLSLLTY